MRHGFSLSLLATALVTTVLAAAVYPQQSDGVSNDRGQGGQKPPARVDGARVERQSAPDPDEADERNMYTDEDVLKRDRRESRISEVESLEMQCFNEVNRIRVGHKL